MVEILKDEETCKIDMNSLAQIRSQLPGIAEEIIDSCNDKGMLYPCRLRADSIPRRRH